MSDFTPSWVLEELIGERTQLKQWAVKNVVQMLHDGATIPFIARYRKEQTGGMEVDKLREIKNQAEELKVVQQKIFTVLTGLQKQNKLNTQIQRSIRQAESLTEVEDLYAPYKPGHKGTLAERARALNLEPVAMACIQNSGNVNLNKHIKLGVKGLSSEKEVQTGIQHIIADLIHRDDGVIKVVKDLCKTNGILIECSKFVTSKKLSAKTLEKAQKAQQSSYKFENYFEFKGSSRTIRPHQVLAINRGEEQKILTVKYTIPESIQQKFNYTAEKKYLRFECKGSVRGLILRAIDDCWSRLVQPQIIRQIRSELTKSAQKSSIDVFSSNLRNLLLSAPVKGHSILGIDPGFRNGCKCAVISQTGQVLYTDVVYLHFAPEMKKKLQETVKKFRCKYIALGNGTACRETEKVLTDVVKNSSAKYCIVKEDGASIYSCSDLAKAELPDLDLTLRGAVSIARRLLDPLAELVKIEPKHIGVGQYQHDIPESQLKVALDSVVEECVSFVGVDLNTGSEALLRRVAGLNLTKAKSVVERREKKGPFTNRNQLKLIKGFGEKSFQQCAGFLRVNHSNFVVDVTEDMPESPSLAIGDQETILVSDDEQPSKGKKRKIKTVGGSKAVKKRCTSSDADPLDETWIHPESYDISYKLMDHIGIKPSELGRDSAIERVKAYKKNHSVQELNQDIQVGEPTIQLILDAFLQPCGYDIREKEMQPLFKEGIRDIASLREGTRLTGKVTNVTHFGAFVDIGVGRDGLIHNSNMKRTDLQLGHRVEVKVIKMDKAGNRIGLNLEHKL
ncbi:S1 RNA-binding domain-containing protein 1-like [Crassostrea angulata]|uniref:S1 RNA-binding domain-containing protein 1-like n=1 Tax=Magallana angulata TaxID=2784310 RepID=UPI0022B0C080|nr:S1 RNA-binding domain-containing protein 1-like [Crassostrea angulata]